MSQFERIEDKNDLADFLNVPRSKLSYLLYHKRIDNCYTSFNILKKNGGNREIHAPEHDLKELLQKLANKLYTEQKIIWDSQNISPQLSHGFEREKSIITNAKAHRNKRFVLNIDLEDFFDSFHFGRVRGFFNKNKHFNMPLDGATALAQLVCYQQKLPQGSPTSPIITNLICQILDFKLLSLARKHRVTYTRYADDITFSTNDKNFLTEIDQFLLDTSTVIEKSGFKINDKKTRLQYKDSKQVVTGLVVNKKVNVDKKFFQITKSMAHSLYTTGEFKINGEVGSLNQLEGRFSFINQLDLYNRTTQPSTNRNNYAFNYRELEYQKFLFFKHFLNTPKPLLVTEGKTDILYLKAALKKHYMNFPHLITLKDDGTFEYQITFFKRTPKMTSFFGIMKDGADTMNCIYRSYTGGFMNGFACKNYMQLFQRYAVTPKNPIILIFDNELASKEKPIRKFISYTKLSAELQAALQQDLRVKLLPDANLYLLTNPLINEKKECEIEDLFTEDTLQTEINGRKFSRKDEPGHYGKDIFSKYIYAHYADIDFSSFLPFLSNLDEIISTYSNS